MIYASGVVVEHKGGFGVHFFGTEGEVQVNRGLFTFQRGAKMIACHAKYDDRTTSCAAEVQKAERAFLKDAKIRLYDSKNHLTDFLECVKTRKKPITSEQVGARSAICCHLMNQAYFHGRKFKWDSGEVHVRRRHGRSGMAHPRLPQPVRRLSGPGHLFEGEIPDYYLPYPWETCMTMGTAWRYKPNDQFKSAGTLIRNLCRIVARNGNYLIGIGPDGNGEFEPTVYARLKELCAWIAVNGEAIYDTRPVKPYERGGCVFTGKRNGVVYCIALAVDDIGTLPEKVSIPSELAANTGEITLLGYGALDSGDTKDGRTTIPIPAAARAQPRSPTHG